MTSLMGTYRYSVDHKGRINVPARFRNQSELPGGDHFVVVRGFEGCLYVYPHNSWEKVEARLYELKTLSNQKARYFLRTLLSNAVDVKLDRQGRIAVPQNLLDLAGIKKEVIVRGVLDKLELWDPDRLEKYETDQPDSYEDVAGELLI